jgi:hypothetical protein
VTGAGFPGPHDYEPEQDYNPDPDMLCPRCVTDVIDPKSFFGWCQRCTEQRPVTLKTARQQRWRTGAAAQRAITS